MTGNMRTDGIRPETQGAITFPIATPGEITRLRMNAFWRARDKRDGYEVELSFDGGKHFRQVAKLGGPTAGTSRYFTFADIPPGRNEVQLRLIGHQVNTAMLFGLRIDADYKQPHGGFRPVKITYSWEEDGKPQTTAHVATRPEESYTIHVGQKAVVKSFSVELAR